MTSRLCSQPFATVRNRSQPFATVRNRPRDNRMAVPMVSSAEGSFLDVSKVSLLSFAWQAWHFVTIQTFFVTCRKSFCVAGAIFLRRFHKIVAVFVACAALWTCPSPFGVASAALQTCLVACFLQIALTRLRQVATGCRFRGRRGILLDVLKVDGTPEYALLKKNNKVIDFL